VRYASPCLGQDHDRDDRADSASEALLVQRPQAVVTPFGGQQGAGVVDES
jgi:hypothetical protein